MPCLIIDRAAHHRHNWVSFSKCSAFEYLAMHHSARECGWLNAVFTASRGVERAIRREPECHPAFPSQMVIMIISIRWSSSSIWYNMMIIWHESERYHASPWSSDTSIQNKSKNLFFMFSQQALFVQDKICIWKFSIKLVFTLNDHTDYCTVLLDPVISGCQAPGGLDQFGKVSPATPAMGGGGGGEGVWQGGDGQWDWREGERSRYFSLSHFLIPTWHGKLKIARFRLRLVWTWRAPQIISWPD